MVLMLTVYGIYKKTQARFWLVDAAGNFRRSHLQNVCVSVYSVPLYRLTIFLVPALPQVIGGPSRFSRLASESMYAARSVRCPIRPSRSKCSGNAGCFINKSSYTSRLASRHFWLFFFSGRLLQQMHAEIEGVIGRCFSSSFFALCLVPYALRFMSYFVPDPQKSLED